MNGIRRRIVVAGVALGGLVAVSAPAVEDFLALRGTVRTPEDPNGYGADFYRVDGVDYLDLNEVARIFHGTKYWRAELEKMVLKIEGHRVRITVGSPYVFVDDVGRNLLAKVQWHDGRIIAPMRLATEVIDELVTENVSWDRGRRTLGVVAGDPNILSVEYDIRENGTIVQFPLGVPLRGEIEFPRPDRVVVRVPGGVLAEPLHGRFSAIGLVDSLITSQEPGEALLTFQLGPLGGSAELVSRRSPPRLLVAVSEGLPDDIPLPEFERRDASPRSPLREVRRIVLDPGHGGSDPGILSPTGVPEKEICLNIARNMKGMLEKNGRLEVRLTREDDRFVSAEARTELANGWDPDVLLSIHCDGWFQPGMRGFSVGVHQMGGADDGDDLYRWGTRTPQAAVGSEILAELVLAELEEDLGGSSRGMKRESYAVLEGATMPAVHVECGFLTHHDEGSTLSEPDHQETVASALAQAIQEYGQVVRDGGGAP